jgi:hypothetical protein
MPQRQEDGMAVHDENLRPTAEDVARRLIILKYVIAYARMAPPRDMLRQISERWEEAERENSTETQNRRVLTSGEPRAKWVCWEHLSAREQDFAQTTAVTMTPSGTSCMASQRIKSFQTQCEVFSFQ